MQKAIQFIPWILLTVLSVILYYGYSFTNARMDKGQAPSNITAMQELDGQVLHWSYPDMAGSVGSFKVLIQDEKLTFECYEGARKGTVITVNPQFSKVAPDIYFLTWLTPMGGEDTMVINLNTNEVHAHVKAMGRFWSMQGTILCNGRKESCDPPDLSKAK